MLKNLLFIAIALLYSISGYAQDSTIYLKYERHFQQAKEFNNVSLFADCIEEIDAAIQIAKEQDWKEEEIESNIYLAEIKRKTSDFEQGLTVLRKLNQSQDYPKLHVKKLGRMAALLNGLSGELTNEFEFRDSVHFYLDSAIEIATKYKFIEEKASLYNELGYTIGRFNIDSSLHYLGLAGKLFKELKDTANYVVVQTNIMRTYVLQNNFSRVNPIVNDLISLTNDDNFKALEVKLEFYRTLTFYYQTISDTINFHMWGVKKYKTMSEVLRNSNSYKLNSYRALFETKKYQEEVAQKEQLLKNEEKSKEELVRYFLLLLIIIFIVGLLLFRESKLKIAVNKANERYHMLLVESNHRIKNNLQMIISMLEFSSKDLEDKESLAFKRMSGKIHTISALHKHLYLDVHNEKVALDTYFLDIIDSYQEITNSNFKIVKNLTSVPIQSERIVYFGLIFNELLSNTIEHSNSKDKIVEISVVQINDCYEFIYQDNSSFNSNLLAGTGTNLIEQLVKRIEGRNYKIESETGKYQFEFYV